MRETFESEYVKCGKKGCKKCPHGPYWYGYRREGGKVKKRYIGKDDPRHARAGEGVAAEPVKRDERDDIFNRRTATIDLAERILGVQVKLGQSKCFSAYKMLVLMNHPDRGGDHREMQYINAAWSFMKGWMQW